MRMIIFAFLALLSVSALAIDVPGGNVSGTWTADNNPYVVQGDIRIPEGETLLIEPGVEVQFAGAYFLRVVGNLHANGAVGDSITFTSSTGNNLWRGLRVDSLAASSDTVRIHHCRITNMQQGKLTFVFSGKFIFEDNHVFNNVGHFAGCMYTTASASGIIRRNRFAYNATSNQSDGGAMYVWDSSPLIEDNVFIGNSATYSGGAISVWRNDQWTSPIIRGNHFEANTAQSGAAIVLHSNTTPIIENNVFLNNETSYDGGAIWQGYILADTVRYSGNLFQGNHSNQKGGAIRIIESKVKFDGDVFVDNSTSNFSGGAIHANDEATIDFRNVRFTENYSSSAGGVKAESSCVLKFDDCVFDKNEAGASGAAFGFSSYVEATFKNCLFVNNTANLGGVANLTQFSHPLFINCTFANNSANNNAGVFYLYWDSDPQFVNCIFHGNESTEGFNFVVQDYIWHTCEPSFDHCLVQGGQESLDLGTSSLGGWNAVVEDDPLFILPSAGAGSGYDGYNANWKFLIEDSPCIDAGNSDHPELPMFDFDGEARVQGDAVDLGIFEGGEAITPPEIQSLTGPSLFCFPDTALITVDVAGTEPFTYQWYFGNLPLVDETEASLSIDWGMDSGDYWCEVSNLAGTVASGDYAVTTNAQIQVSEVTIVEPALCDGDEALVDISISGGTPDYLLWIDGGEASVGLNVISTGPHALLMEDALGCQQEWNINVEGPPAIILEFGEIIEPTCQFCSDGSISWTTNGTLLEVNGEELEVAELIDLAPGTYTFTVYNELGCYYEETLTLEDDDDNSEIDFNGDGEVNSGDLLEFIANYGCTGFDCAGDLNFDGIVNAFDLILFLGLY
ncbi:right-handed parallel beta-helix repeat-containing protein [Sanyastnella coralliicola]|uniref:right-handed parallel beta-helix repeat-containing protein n=1 Tax=Sanyastnella coralliicola TaxID=3069118 RepID=UPI0027B9424A|nr:right-handed parallel beta-helix repeat-containing protein [Longitalea sp. SCSIO 12813]